METGKKNRHFGRDYLYVGGLYELRDCSAKADGRRVEHDPVRLRTVLVRAEDNMVLVGVSFRGAPGDAVDDQGFRLEVGCECSPNDLRSAL